MPISVGTIEESPYSPGTCDVYVDTSIPPLSFTHLRVKLYDDYLGDALKSNKKPKARTVYRYDPTDYDNMLHEEQSTDSKHAKS